MTSTTLIGTALASPTFGTTATAKVTWTPAAGKWTAGTTTATDAVPYVASVGVFLWGSAADKQGEDPYKTMNTWYTTNKAAIDSASLTNSVQVASWAMYLDIATNVISTNLQMPGHYDVTGTPGHCSMPTSTSTGPVTVAYTAASLTVVPSVGQWGDHFAIGIKNKTTTAMSPALVWGARTLTSGTANVHTGPTAAVPGTGQIEWQSYLWTETGSVTDWNTAFTLAEVTALTGSDTTPITSASVFATQGATFSLTTPLTGEITCDTTKWASATACDGVTRWGLGTFTEATGTVVGSTTAGSRRAWLWLADMNPTAAASVFGVEASDELQITVFQHKVITGDVPTDASATCNVPLLASFSNNLATAQFNQNNWGIAYYSHTGASATLLGASAVMVALASFF